MANKTISVYIKPTKKTKEIDTGIDIGPNDAVRVTASGRIVYSVFGNKIYSYPEGIYKHGKKSDSYAPNETISYGTDGLEQNGFAYPDVQPYSLAVILGDGLNREILQGNRDTTYLASLNGTGRVLIAYNRNKDLSPSFFQQNEGIITVTVEKIEDGANANTGLPPHPSSPIRFVPSRLLAKKRQTNFASTFFWYIKPRYGPAEAYASWDVSLACPEYSNEFGLTGNVTPAMIYKKNHGVDLSSIPTSIKNDVKAPDVKAIRLDWGKVLSGYYMGAYVEVFEADPEGDFSARYERTLWVVGEMGQAEVADNEATIEISPITEWINRQIGARVQPICDVGRIPGETFGRGRCYNLVKHDGPNIELLTRGGILIAYNSLSYVTLAPLGVGGYAPFEGAFRGDYGRLVGVTGPNSGVVRDIGAFDGDTGNITLRQSLPLLPNIGDTWKIEAGCNGTMGMCKSWNNLKNSRFFAFVPGRKAMLNHYRVS